VGILGSAGRREGAALIVKRDNSAGRVDLPRVCIALSVDIFERVDASPIDAGASSRIEVFQPRRVLVFDNGGAQDERRRAEDAVE